MMKHDAGLSPGLIRMPLNVVDDMEAGGAQAKGCRRQKRSRSYRTPGEGKKAKTTKNHCVVERER
jgi:hypothetical protein